MFNDVDPAPSYASDPEAARYAKLWSKFDIFRLLIVGRANAGKTTILQKIYNTTEAPVVLNSEGKEASSQSYLCGGPLRILCYP